MAYDPENNPYIPGDPSSYDLKWVVDQLNEHAFAEESAAEAKASAEAAAASAEEASGYADDAEGFKDAAAGSADAAADSEQAAHDYAANIADPVSGLVTQWLADNITQPTTPAIDASLTVSGAAADAAVTGDDLRMLIDDEYEYEEFNWQRLAINSYLQGWGSGYYNPDGSHGSSQKFMSTVTSKYVDLTGSSYVELIPPSGACIAALCYDAADNISSFGHPNSQNYPELIDVPVIFNSKDLVKAYITVGYFTDNSGTAKAQDASYVKTIKLRMYYPKEKRLGEESAAHIQGIDTLSIQENGRGLFYQGGYSRAGAALAPNSVYYPTVLVSDYITDDIQRIDIAGARSATVLAWNTSDVYQGFLCQEFVFTNNSRTEIAWYKHLDIGRLREVYPEYKFKVEIELDATIQGTLTNIPITDSQYVTFYRASQDHIQDYYLEEMESTIEAVRAELTEPALVFPLITDIHYKSVNSYFDYSVMNIKKFSEAVKCDFILNLGDNTDGDTAQDVTLGRNFHMLTEFNGINAPYYQAIGNHDTNYYNGAPLFNSDQIWQSYYSNTKDVTWDMTAGEKNYYKDFEDLGIRLIVLDADHGNKYRYSANTASWLSTKALITNKIVILATHLSPIGHQNWNGTTPTNGSAVETAIQNFVLQGGTVIQLCGHSHADYHFTTPWLCIYNGCQKFIQEDTTTSGYAAITGAASSIVSPARTAGTASEDLWTVAIIKPISRTVDMIRFGAGSDRSFSF